MCNMQTIFLLQTNVVCSTNAGLCNIEYGFGDPPVYMSSSSQICACPNNVSCPLEDDPTRVFEITLQSPCKYLHNYVEFRLVNSAYRFFYTNIVNDRCFFKEDTGFRVTGYYLKFSYFSTFEIYTSVYNVVISLTSGDKCTDVRMNLVHALLNAKC